MNVTPLQSKPEGRDNALRPALLPRKPLTPTPSSFSFKHLDPICPSLSFYTTLSSYQRCSGSQHCGSIPPVEKCPPPRPKHHTYNHHIISNLLAFAYAVPFTRGCLSLFLCPASFCLASQLTCHLFQEAFPDCTLPQCPWSSLEHSMYHTGPYWE